MTQTATKLQATQEPVEKPQRIMRSYKYRLFPTKEQEDVLKSYIDQLRDIWNRYVKLNKERYEKGEERLTWVTASTDYTAHKSANPDAFDVPRDIVTAMFKDLEQAYQAAYSRMDKYYKKKAAGIPLEPGEERFGFPKLRNNEYQNMHIKCNLLPERWIYGFPGYIKFPGKLTMKYLLTRPLPESYGPKKYAAVISYKGGHWQIVIQVEIREDPKKAPNKSITIRTDRPHGIALEEDKLENDYRQFRQRVMRTYKNWQRKQSCRQGYETPEERKAREEHNRTCPKGKRILAPKKSNNFRRAHANLSRLGHVLRNIHVDYMHKFANHLVQNYRHIHIDVREWEHLRIKSVINAEDDLHCQNCGELITMLEEKLQLYPDSTLKITKPLIEEKDDLTKKRYRVRFVKLLEGRKWKEIHTEKSKEYRAFKKAQQEKKKKKEEEKRQAESGKPEEA